MSINSGNDSTIDDSEQTADPVRVARALDLEKLAAEIDFRKQTMQQLYTLGDELMPSSSKGKGSKAVIKATRASDGRQVVVKLRHKEKGFKDNQELVDWVQMMKLLYILHGAGSQHKSNYKSAFNHVAAILDIIDDGEFYFCVMEYVRGRDLFDFFVEEKLFERPYKVALGRQLAQQVAKGVTELHEQGLIHKDLKLENIVLDEWQHQQGGTADLRCSLKIIDFDTVEIYRAGVKSFHVLGTDQYIAPESYSGYSSEASDAWAIGVMLYTLLTGTFPFHYALFDDEPGENYVGHPRMGQIRRRLRIARIDWGNPVWKDSDCKDFVRRALMTDAKRRVTLDDMRKHAWLKKAK